MKSVKVTVKVSSAKLQKLKDRMGSSTQSSQSTPGSPAASGSCTPSTKAKAKSGGSSHAKSGPKDMDSVINSQLRALDRTGKPPRHWVKSGVQIKSFTGAVMELPLWTSTDKGMSERDFKPKVKVEPVTE